MTSIYAKSFDSPDEVRTPPMTTVDVVSIGSTNAARYTFEPGWKWSECIKPVAGGDACMNTHLGVCASGRLHVQHGDESMEIGPGDAYHITPGHDAWVIGDEPYVGYEFELHAATTFGAER